MVDILGGFFGRRSQENASGIITKEYGEYKIAVLQFLEMDIRRLSEIPDGTSSNFTKTRSKLRQRIIDSQRFDQLGPSERRYLQELVLDDVDRLSSALRRPDLDRGQSKPDEIQERLEFDKKILKPILTPNEYDRYFPPRKTFNSGIQPPQQHRDSSVSPSESPLSSNVIDMETRRPITSQLETDSSGDPHPPAA